MYTTIVQLLNVFIFRSSLYTLYILLVKCMWSKASFADLAIKFDKEGTPSILCTACIFRNCGKQQLKIQLKQIKDRSF